jgi:hypothetical protein
MLVAEDKEPIKPPEKNVDETVFKKSIEADRGSKGEPPETRRITGD